MILKIIKFEIRMAYTLIKQKNKWGTVSRQPPFAQIYAKTDAKILLFSVVPNFFESFFLKYQKIGDI